MDHNQYTPRRRPRPPWGDQRGPQTQERQPRDPSRRERTSHRMAYSPMERNWQDRRARRTSWSPPRRRHLDRDSPPPPRGQRSPRYRSPPPRNSGTYWTRYVPPKRVRFQPLITSMERTTITPAAARGRIDSDTSSDQHPTPRHTRAPQPRPTTPSTSTSADEVTDESDQTREGPTDVLVHTLAELLRAQHHWYDVTTVTIHGLFPEGYADELRRLISRLIPSKPQPETTEKLTEAADNFMRTAYAILEDHYTAAIDHCCTTLASISDPNVEQAWFAAIPIASAGLRAGLKTGTIERVMAILPKNLTDTTTTEAWEPPVSQPNMTTAPIIPTTTTTTTRTVPQPFSVAALVTMPDSPISEDPPAPFSMELFSQPLVTPAEVTTNQAPRQEDLEWMENSQENREWNNIRDSTPDSSQHLPAAQGRPDPSSLRLLIESPLLAPSNPMGYMDTSTPTRAPTSNPLDTRAEAPPTGSIAARRNVDHSWAQHTVHHHNKDKSSWTISPTHPVIIMGDSNLKWLPHINDPSIQVDAFPGATVAHAAAILRKLPTTYPVVTKVILSFGLNGRNRGTIQSFSRSLNETYDLAVEKFPLANIWVPQIAFSNYLPGEEHTRIHQINDLIGRLQHIKALPRHLFHTQRDNIHWHPSTGEAIWDLWKQTLN